MQYIIKLIGGGMYIKCKNEESYESHEKDSNGNDVTTTVAIAEVLNGFVLSKQKSWKEPIKDKQGEFEYKEESEAYISKDNPSTKKDEESEIVSTANSIKSLIKSIANQQGKITVE